MLDMMVPVTFWLLPMLATMASLRSREHGSERPLPRPSAMTMLLWCVVAIPGFLQLVEPQLLSLLRRDWPLIMEGQAWRLVSSVVVQDGGLVGMVFNLTILAFVILGTQDRWSSARTWVTFWVGALIANCIVGPSLNPSGAGSSMATFIVATALATRVLLSRPPRQALVLAAGALACVAYMIAAGNYHGFAALVGTAAGLVPTRDTVRQQGLDECS
ncbi:MAG TPA: rhomboid family intramembrane serine protease [Candidatus Nocardiopsis merdipullorum]|nr:rhomboid family intramembrane serine protease [Candidatus Nocardiopsis merdipullorum]